MNKNFLEFVSMSLPTEVSESHLHERTGYYQPTKRFFIWYFIASIHWPKRIS